MTNRKRCSKCSSYVKVIKGKLYCTHCKQELIEIDLINAIHSTNDEYFCAIDHNGFEIMTPVYTDTVRPIHDAIGIIDKIWNIPCAVPSQKIEV